MDQFTTTYTLAIDGHSISEIDIRVSPPAWEQLPLTIEAATLDSPPLTTHWIEIPPTHPLHRDIRHWLGQSCPDQLRQTHHTADLRQKSWEKHDI